VFAVNYANNTDGAQRLLIAYYAATLLFLLFDYVLHINVRLAFLEAWPGWRAAYYALCFSCLALLLWRPALAEIVGAVESLLTLVALILNMAIRSMVVTDEMLETGVGLVTTPEIINFIISGSIAYYAWFNGMKHLKESL
jgi:hypothetical protein